MTTRDIPEEAVNLCLSWIDVVERSLPDYVDNAVTKEIMKNAGNKCAEIVLEDCASVLGHPPRSVDELLEAVNRSRWRGHRVADSWEREGNYAHLKTGQCGCILVHAGLVRPNPVHCQCSIGLIERLFSTVCSGEVEVELLKAVGYGDDGCEFVVYFEED